MLGAHASEVEPGRTFQPTPPQDTGDLRAKADAELGYHPPRTRGRLVRQEPQNGVTVPSSVHRHRLSVFHEHDENGDIGIEMLDECERLSDLVRRLVEGAEHESVTVV